MDPQSTTVRELFLATARVVAEAVGDPAVGEAWDRPSVLEDQLVGGLAGHLARGSVWVVDDYLSAALPDVERVDSAAEYFARFGAAATPEDERQIRARGALVAARGQADISVELAGRIEALTVRLAAEPSDRSLGVVGGAVVMGLDPYLETRIVEQVVHLDDLARSLDHRGWPVPPEAEAVAIRVGADIGRLRRGPTAMVRVLYRTRVDPVLPVL